MNNEDKHWLAAKVDLLSRHITLFDSARGATQDWFQFNNAECLQVLFLYLLEAGGFYKDRPSLKSEATATFQPFTISREEKDKCPQQSVSGDCAVFMVKCIEYLSAWRELDYVQDNMQFFREKYAVDIFHRELSM